MLRRVAIDRQLPALGFLESISLSGSERKTAQYIAVILLGLIAWILDPSVGVIAMEIGFPILAAYILLDKTVDPFAPNVLFPAVYLLWFWLGNIPILTDDKITAVTSNSSSWVWFYSLLGLLAYLCGTFIIRERSRDVSTPRIIISGKWRVGPLLIVFALAAAGVCLTWASIVAGDGIVALKANADTLRLEIPERHRVAFQILVLLADLMLPLTFLYLWTTTAAKFRKALYAFSLFIILVFVSLGNRGLVLPSVLTVFAMRHYLRRPWSIRFVMTTGLIIVLLLSVSGYYRSLSHFGPTYVRDLDYMGIPTGLQPFTNIYLYVRAPIETFRNVTTLMPDVMPFQHGVLTFGFLQQLLPGHHPSSDFFFKDLLGHTFAGYGEPASILGTFYGDLGGPGIVLGMFLTGVVTKLMYVRLLRHSLLWLLLYCYFWQVLIGSVYGSLITYVSQVLVPIGWATIIWALTNRGDNSRVVASVAVKP